MDFNEFNEWKSQGFKTKTEQEYQAWQESFKTWYSGREWTDWEKNLIKEQIGKLNEQKQAWFEKQKTHPQIVRNSYIFQDNLANAVADLCGALTKYINSKI